MKFQNIFSLYFITLTLSVLSTIAEPVCEDSEGNLIPCQKVVEKISDFDLASSKTKQKRDYYSDWLNSWLWNPWNWWYNTRTPTGTSRTTIRRTTIQTINRTTKTVPAGSRTTKTIPNSNRTTKTVIRTTVRKTTTPIRRTTTKVITTVRTTTRTTAKKNTTINSKPTTSASSTTSSSLDRKPFSMTGFTNCSSDERQKIEKTIEDIITYRAAGLQVAKDTSDPQNNQIFLKYFKNENTRSQVVKVLENVNNMSTAKAYCEPNTDSACREQAIAWTYLYSKEFHVCPAFFTQVWHGTIEKHTSEAASVILHELTHCHGTDDYAYGDAGCNQLDATRASNNADSFRLFCMNAIYHLNDKSNGVMKFVNNTNIDFRVEPFQDKVIIRAVEKK